MNRKNVYMFKMKSCPHCNDLEKLLTHHKIKFKTIDIHQHEKLWKIVMTATGFDHVPQLLVNEWNGTDFINSKYVSDFDTLDEAVQQVQFLLNNDVDNQVEEKNIENNLKNT